MFFSIKRCLVPMCCALLALCLSACGASDSLSLPAASAPQAKKPDPPTPEKAAEIFLENINLWQEAPESAVTYGYCLLDLDFDGAPELISSVCAGTGMYSDNKVYRINPATLAVEQITTGQTRGEAPDFFYLNDRSKLLKNTETGKLFYLVEDYVRVGDREGAESYYEVYWEKGELRSEVAFSESFSPDYEGGTNTTVRTFSFRGETLSKVEYDQKLDAYYAENIDQKGKWSAIDGEKFAAGDQNTKKKTLLAACLIFSYGEPQPDDPDKASDTSETAESAKPSKTA